MKKTKSKQPTDAQLRKEFDELLLKEIEAKFNMKLLWLTAATYVYSLKNYLHYNDAMRNMVGKREMSVGEFLKKITKQKLDAQ